MAVTKMPLEYSTDIFLKFKGETNLADSMGGVPGLLEILRQDLEAGVEAVWLESLHCAPLHPCQILYHEI